MPTYTFENKAGDRREYIAPMRSRSIHRDGDRWNRVKEPEGFQIAQPEQPYRQSDDIKKGYYKAEQEGWSSKFSKAEIKKAWDL